MRYPAHETALKHEKIVREAAKLFRVNGFAGASIPQVMKSAGLTHGAFYAHFDSKEALICASVEQAMDNLTDELRELAETSQTPKAAFLARYLSAMHRDHPGEGCAMPALASEIAREPTVRHAFTERLKRVIDTFGSVLPWNRSRAKDSQTIYFTAAIVGAMVLARAVDDPELSERILAATKEELLSH